MITISQIKKLCPIGTTHYKHDVYLTFCKNDGEFVYIWMWGEWTKWYPSELLNSLGLSRINPYI